MPPSGVALQWAHGRLRADVEKRMSDETLCQAASRRFRDGEPVRDGPPPPFPAPRMPQWAHPAARALVRIWIEEHRGRIYTVVLAYGADPLLERFLRVRLSKLLSLPAAEEGERLLFPGDRRVRLRAELKHRGIRVKG